MSIYNDVKFYLGKIVYKQGDHSTMHLFNAIFAMATKIDELEAKINKLEEHESKPQ